MTFISFTFALLVGLTLVARLTLGRKHTEGPYLAVLILASALFYCWHVPAYTFLLLAITAIDYFTASAVSGGRRPWLLGLSLTANIGLLGFFKYFDFFVDGAQSVLFVLGRNTALNPLGLILPIGISFYTFHSMSYTIDAYRGVLRPLTSYPRFFLFVSFFPQMMAGPILRASEFLPQFTRTRRLHWKVFTEGCYLIIRGLFLKTVLADNLGQMVGAYWNEGPALTTTFLFAGQIFCDFEGYCSIGRGLGYWLGYRIPLNFNFPYLAHSFQNFWERWHISLSSWFRDYLYISIGGNRISVCRTYLNLLVVMVIAGIWHGANATFIAWGALHGVALVVERMFKMEKGSQRPFEKVVWFCFVQGIVLAGWVFFRSPSLRMAFQHFKGMSILDHPIPTELKWGLLLLMPVALMHLRALYPKAGKKEKAIVGAVMLWLTLVAYGRTDAFLYFQF